MDPIDVAREVEVMADPKGAGLLVRVSSTLLVVLVILVLSGVGINTLAAWNAQKQIESLTGSISKLTVYVEEVAHRLRSVEVEGSVTVNLRLDRIEHELSEMRASLRAAK